MAGAPHHWQKDGSTWPWGTSFCLSSQPHGSSMVHSALLFIPTKHNSSPHTPTAAGAAIQQSTVTEHPISRAPVLDPRSVKSSTGTVTVTTHLLCYCFVSLQLVLLSFNRNLFQETGVKVWKIVEMTNKTWIEKFH